MREYEGRLWGVVTEEIRAFAVAARASSERMFTIINDVGLIADPEDNDPEYPDQLVWTYKIASEPENRQIVGEREFYQNLVPELRALATVLLQDFDRLDVNDARAVLKWLRRLMPVSWCKWARPSGEAERRIIDGLARSTKFIVREGGQIFQSRHFALNTEWFESAEKLLSRN